MLALMLATIVFALLGPDASEASPLERRACSKYQIITARGTGIAQGSTTGYTGMLGTVLKRVSGGSHYDLVYPANGNFVFPPPTSQDSGVANLTAYLQASVKSCPSQTYALIGYSQGAEVINRVLLNVNSTTNATLWNLVKAVVYVGNPSHHPNNAANFDQDGGNLTQPFTGEGIWPGISAPLTPYIKAKKLHDICYTHDDVCASDDPNKVAFKYHMWYENTTSVQAQGSNFMIAKLTA
ncbi:hypothetical protein OC845_005972 [Tilletia horrida]|nr:hypothetical protein OC845_005972 [Tilletia horrida]